MPTDSNEALGPALRDVESIQSLDTARLALRWALERMRTLENEARERERYYSKIEEYLNLKLEGGIDPAALAKRETRLEELEAETQRREIDAERALKAAQLRRDEELHVARAECAAASQARLLEARGDYDKRVAALERTLSERQISLHEKEARLSAQERALEERRKHFEEFHAAQRAALERESASINQTAEDQAVFLERRIERALAAKTKALESAAQAEKQLLFSELAEWRAKAREHLPALLDAQRRADAAAERAERLEAELASSRRSAEELSKMEGVLAAKMRDAEQNVFRQYDAWVRREEELRRRDQDWLVEAQARRESAEALRADLALLQEELKKTVAAYRAKLEMKP